MVLIKRTYNFAGKVHTEEKLVARDSAEAKLHFASLGENAEPNSGDTAFSPKRKPRKAFRSVFEPITDQISQRSDLNLGMAVRLRARELAQEENAKKLNTVEKSRMDWAGFVDKEGLKDELELAGKSKTSFAARQDFLARSDARREDDARKARLAGKA
jgi:glutamate synthase domain-containing protein 1